MNVRTLNIMSQILRTWGLGIYPHSGSERACTLGYSEDVVISVLFPYLLPSLPVCTSECWSRKHIRSIFEHLLLFYCDVSVGRIQELLKTFVRRVLSLTVSSSSNRNLDQDLHFLADIEGRCSFDRSRIWKSNAYSLYACSFLIENEVDLKVGKFNLVLASQNFHKDTVILLIKYKGGIHASKEYALRWTSLYGNKDIVALLLEHEADIHALDDFALRWASFNGHKDTVALLLEHKADVHAKDDQALEWATDNGHKDTIALLLEHKASHKWG
jgi:hypothetical protein